MILYVGSYTEPGMGNARGISRLAFDVHSGVFDSEAEVVEAPNPSYLAMSHVGASLYAVDERETGGVRSYRRDPATGALVEINSQPTGGAHPCYLALDPSGRFLLVVNYSGGNLAVFPIGEDGALEPASQVLAHHGSSIDPNRQQEPHPHMIAPSPDGRFVYVTDLGTDQIVRYRLDSELGQLVDPAATDCAQGMGPRHFAFSPDGRTMIVIGELDSTLTSFTIQEDGSLEKVSSVSTLPADFTGSSTCAHVLLSPDGRFVYGSNRGHESIAVAAFDAPSQRLEIVEFVQTGGREPRNFALTPDGRWLLAANQLTGTITVFSRDSESGRLTPTGASIDSPTPVALLFANDR